MRNQILKLLKDQPRTSSALAIVMHRGRRTVKEFMPTLEAEGAIKKLWAATGGGVVWGLVGIDYAKPEPPPKPKGKWKIPPHCDLMAAFYGLRLVI